VEYQEFDVTVSSSHALLLVDCRYYTTYIGLAGIMLLSVLQIIAASTHWGSGGCDKSVYVKTSDGQKLTKKLQTFSVTIFYWKQ